MPSPAPYQNRGKGKVVSAAAAASQLACKLAEDHEEAEMTSTTGEAAPAKRLDSQRAQAQLELKDRALAASAEGITIADASLPDNPLIYANAGFERLTGYSVAEVLGRKCRFLQGPGTDPATLDTLRTAIREKRAVTVQLLNYRKDGTMFWNRLSITPVEDASGEVTHFIGVQSDVTAEKQAKDALQNANEQLVVCGKQINDYPVRRGRV
jgi:PAS domain S-box-containing protein